MSRTAPLPRLAAPPWSGRVSSPDDILDASVLLAKAMGLQGMCEVEFRRDAAIVRC